MSDQPDFLGDAEAAPASSPASTSPLPPPGRVKNGVRNRIVIFGGILLVCVFLAYTGFMRAKSATQPEQLPADVKGVEALPPPGQMQEGSTALASSPQYQEMQHDVDLERIKKAEAEGRSAFATADMLSPSPASAAASAAPQPQQPMDPAMRAELERARAAELQAYAQREAQLMAKAQQFMIERREAWAPRGTEIIGFGDRSMIVSTAAAATLPSAAQTTATAAQATTGQKPVTLIEAGTLVSAITVNKVNTDVLAPVVAKIVSGKFAGATLIGNPTRAGEVAKIDFTTISIPGYPNSMPVSAFSLDAETLEAGVATSVDRKWFAKYFLRPTAAAVAAVGEAAKTAGSTTTINVVGGTTSTNPPLDGKRIGQIMGGAVGEQVAKDLTADSTDPTVRVGSKVVIGVIFTSDVVYTPK